MYFVLHHKKNVRTLLEIIATLPPTQGHYYISRTSLFTIIPVIITSFQFGSDFFFLLRGIGVQFLAIAVQVAATNGA